MLCHCFIAKYPLLLQSNHNDHDVNQLPLLSSKSPVTSHTMKSICFNPWGSAWCVYSWPSFWPQIHNSSNLISYNSLLYSLYAWHCFFYFILFFAVPAPFLANYQHREICTSFIISLLLVLHISAQMLPYQWGLP